MALPRLTGYLKGSGLYLAERGCDEITSLYPISTLPEHLHSTSLSYAETT